MTRFLKFVCAAGALSVATAAYGQTGPILDLSWNTIDGGGGTSTGSGFTLSGTIGQHDAGVMTGGGYEITGGFWPGITETCYPDCNNNGELTVADFACFQTRFVSTDAYADCNGTGTLTVADFACFQTKFVQGCP
jgi:hypothetical protein